MAKKLKLSVIIPVYNEKKTILEVLSRIEKVKIENISKEIIIVDDYSTDGTKEVLKDIKKDYKIFYHKKNFGKGRAVRTGLENCTGDIIIIQDADLEYDPNDYKKLIVPIIENKSKVVYGSRFKSSKGALKENRFFTYEAHTIGNYGLTMITNLLYFSRLTDMESCYKVFTKEVKEKLNLKSDRFDIEPEITAKILKKGYKIKELPINYYSRDFSEGKKINWKDGIVALLTLIRYRFLD
jgi:dolichol-phosphate mannosyltransferase